MVKYKFYALRDRRTEFISKSTDVKKELVLSLFSIPTAAKLLSEVGKVTETVKNVAHVVEKVAGLAGKVSAKVAGKLPNHGKLKNTALLVESISKEAIKDAHFIHKGDELKPKVMETVSEPFMHPEKLLDKEDNGE